MVEWTDDFHQPTGDTAAVFNKFINRIAKRNDIFPLYNDWSHHSPESMMEAWDYVTVTMNLEPFINLVQFSSFV